MFQSIKSQFEIILSFFDNYLVRDNNLLTFNDLTVAANIDTFKLSYFIPEIFLCFFLITLLIIFIFIKGATNSDYYFKSFTLISFFGIIFTIFLYLSYLDCNEHYIFLNQFKTNGSIIFIKVLTLIFSAILLLFFYNSSIYYWFIQIEHIFLMLFSVLGGLILLSTNDFISFYLSLEILTIPLYVLVASNYRSNFSTEGGLKYFIVGSFSSGLLLFGFSFIYGFSGISNFDDLELFLLSFSFDNTLVDIFFIVGVLFFFIGLLIKIGVAPFHFWVADVYIGAPMPFTIFLMTVPKIILWGVFYNMALNIFYVFIPGYLYTLFYICVFSSFFFGIFPGLFQIKLKRLLIYSSISSNGFLLMPLFANSFSALYLFLFFYLLSVSGFFAFYMMLRRQETGKIIVKISELNNLFQINPSLAIASSIILFSIAGIPPLAGFFGKFYIFISVFSENYSLIFFALLFSCVSTFYYIRLIKWMFFAIDLNPMNKNSLLFIKDDNFFYLFYVFLVAYFNLFVFFFYNDIISFFELIFLQ